jgi:hypothetical protein
MSNLALEALELKKKQLVDEQSKMNERFDNEIREINVAIDTLCGAMVQNYDSSLKYDDENPDYIRSSQEEI